MSKRCFKCRRMQELTEFYAHPGMADGHLNKCKTCTKKDTANRVALKLLEPLWVLGERRRHREKSRRYRELNTVQKETAEQTAERIAKWQEANPEKRQAHLIVGKAIRSGRLIRQRCERCLFPFAQAHHEDYSKPLDVMWLCTKHHGEYHAAKRDAELVAATP